MRDVHAERVLHVVVNEGKQGTTDFRWSLSDSLSMGFERVGELKFDCIHIALYGFDIQRYKSSPDWLNARHWAHPQRWDQDRW